MNYPIALAGLITLLAFFAHAFAGIREAMSTAPAKLTEKEKITDFVMLDRNWVQLICVFQLVSIDLLVLSSLAFLLAFTDIIIQKKLLAFSLATFYVLWGSAWLVQLFIFKRSVKDFLLLSQWLFWFVCAGLIYWGAQSYV